MRVTPDFHCRLFKHPSALSKLSDINPKYYGEVSCVAPSESPNLFRSVSCRGTRASGSNTIVKNGVLPL